MKTGIVFILVFLTGFSGFGQGRVDSIAIENLRRTKADYVKQWLRVEVGDSLDLEAVENDVQELKDLNLFFDVEYRIDTIEQKSVLCYIIKEARYVYPSFGNVASSQNINFSIGVTDINFLGRGQHFGAEYRFYDRHSGKIFHSAPVHKNGKTGHTVVLGSYASVEPLYFDDGPRDFNFDNYHISLEGRYWLKRYWNVSVGGMYMFEQYKNISDSVGFFDMTIENGQQFQFHKYQVRAGTQWRRINFHNERREGIMNRVHAEYIQTFGFQQPFVKVTNDLRWYRLVGECGNFAARSRLGISTNNEGPFAPFLIDNYENIRGSGNRVARGTAEVSFNLEYMMSLWDHKWFTLQSTAFTDFGTLRAAGADFRNFVDNAMVYRYAGLGVRIHSKVLYRTILRFDYSFNLRDLNQSAFVVGFGQYF
ncbi:MAG: hypothetical protein Crog4KO_23120 [Crocinitomicaceae bacterium]